LGKAVFPSESRICGWALTCGDVTGKKVIRMIVQKLISDEPFTKSTRGFSGFRY
jgi:hypothetical protein